MTMRSHLFPFPNTEVKLIRVESARRETAREGVDRRRHPLQQTSILRSCCFTLKRNGFYPGVPALLGNLRKICYSYQVKLAIAG